MIINEWGGGYPPVFVDYWIINSKHFCDFPQYQDKDKDNTASWIQVCIEYRTHALIIS